MQQPSENMEIRYTFALLMVAITPITGRITKGWIYGKPTKGARENSVLSSSTIALTISTTVRGTSSMKSSNTTVQMLTTELIHPTNSTLPSTVLTSSATLSLTSTVRLSNTTTQISTTDLIISTISTLSLTALTHSTASNPTSSVILSDTESQTSSKKLLIVTSTVAAIVGIVGLIFVARGVYALMSRHSRTHTRVTPSLISSSKEESNDRDRKMLTLSISGDASATRSKQSGVPPKNDAVSVYDCK